MDSAIRLVDVTKTFPGSATPAVDDLRLAIPAGAITVLVGPSGCGKTTVLRMINRLVEPTSGHVLIGGVDVRTQPAHELRRRIGYVIQSGGLFPHRTVADNIATVPRLEGWPQTRVSERVRELAQLVGLDPELLDRYPATLSGGQRQRVGVARALAVDPPVLLMDEPYSAVDPIVRARLQDELLALQDRLTRTVVVVTHDIDEAVRLADRLAVVSAGAHLEQYASPDEVLRNPASPFVEAFVGRDRFLRRTGLLRVADAPLDEVPILDPDTAAADALAMLGATGDTWALVVSPDDVPLGWVSDTNLARADATACVADAVSEPAGPPVHAGTSLRSALDGIVGTPQGAAVVVDDDGRFEGVVSTRGVTAALLADRSIT